MTTHCVSNFNFESNKYGKFYRNINYLLPDDTAINWLQSRLMRVEPKEKDTERKKDLEEMKRAFEKRNGMVVLK